MRSLLQGTLGQSTEESSSAKLPSPSGLQTEQHTAIIIIIVVIVIIIIVIIVTTITITTIIIIINILNIITINLE